MSTLSDARLYEIADELVEIDGMLFDSGGEITPDVEAKLDALTGALEGKVDRIAELVRSHELGAEAADAEATRLAALSKSRSRAAKGLKDYLLTQMERMDRLSVETGRFVVKVTQNGRPAIHFGGNLMDLPPKYVRTTVNRSVDGNLAYDEWRAGRPLPDGFVVSHGRHLRIR